MPRAEPGYSPRVIVKFRDNVGLPYDDNVARQLEERRIGPWPRLAERFPGISMRRLFNSVEPERIEQLVTRAMKRNDRYRPPDFFSFFVIDVPEEVVVEDVIRELSQWESVQHAYFDPPGEDPGSVNASDPGLRNPGYLEAAPVGIDARYAWEHQGGMGAGQQMIDLEKGWTLDHLDIKDHGITKMCGDNIESSRPHGTSVLGVVCAAHGQSGALGIAPEVDSVKVISHFGSCEFKPTAVSSAIVKVVSSLPADTGAVLLLEVQRLGIPVEISDDVYAAIQLAVNHGIIVIEAAGNGGLYGVNLDDFADINQDRVLARSFRDSGAIMVGAAHSGLAPISNTHSRASVSNYGSRIDCYAWGENVATATSTANAPFAVDEYRLNFDGTSSAAAIIAGAALLVQGMARASLRPPLSPLEMRNVLGDKTLGTESNDHANCPIGVMPDLRRIIKSGRIGNVPQRALPGR